MTYDQKYEPGKAKKPDSKQARGRTYYMARAVKHHASECNISNREIARACGVTHPTIATWLEGYCNLVEFDKMLQAVGMTWEQVLNYSNFRKVS